MRKAGTILGAVLLGALALALITGGGIALFSEQALRTVDSAAEGRMPETVGFDAEEGRYGIALFAGATDSLARDTRCEITLANEERKSIRGDVQAISVSGKIKSVGEFAAVPGRTEVSCRLVERDQDLVSQRFAVSRIHKAWRTAALVAIGAGVVALLLGVWVLFRGLLGSRPGSGRFGGTSRPA